MVKIKRLVMLNQMAGPLFRELAEGLAPLFEDGCLLQTGHPDTLALKTQLPEKIDLIISPAYDRSTKLKRIISWIKYLIFISRMILCSKKTDGFLLTTNPPILCAWFWLLSRFRHQPYIVLVYDIHPDVFVMMGIFSINNPVVKMWHWMNNKVYRDAKAVATLGKHMASKLSRQYDIDLDKLYVTHPWVDTEVIKPIAYKKNPLVKEFSPETKHIVLYSGNMGISHDIGSILEVAKRLNNRDDILFLFVGGGEKWQDAIDFKNRHNLDNVKVYPYQSESQLPYSMALSSISIVTLDKGAEKLMVPSKVFYYMAAGSAVIGICQGENELLDVIEGNECGLCVQPNNPTILAKTIEDLIKDKVILGQYRMNARQAAVDLYSRKRAVEKFISILKKVELISNEKSIKSEA